MTDHQSQPRCGRSGLLRGRQAPSLRLRAGASFYGRRRTPEPTLTQERSCLSVCHPEAELRRAWCEVWGKIVEGRHKVMFRDRRRSERDQWCVPHAAAQTEQGTERQSGVERRGHRTSAVCQPRLPSIIVIRSRSMIVTTLTIQTLSRVWDTLYSLWSRALLAQSSLPASNLNITYRMTLSPLVPFDARANPRKNSASRFARSVCIAA